MALFSAIFLICISIMSILYGYIKYSFRYWKSKNIPCDKPSIPYGSTKGLGKTVNLSQFSKRLYDKYKSSGAKFCGAYYFICPVAIILDLDLVKKILVKDFASFTSRGIYYNEEDDPLSAHLFSLDGERWKELRPKFSPTFSSGKLKIMFQNVMEVANRLVNRLSDEIQHHDELDMKDWCARYTIDVIGTCAFGIECNSLEDPNAEFRYYGQKMFEAPRHGRVFTEILHVFRTLCRKLHIKKYPDDVTKFFFNVVRDTVEYREKHNIARNDFMDLLIKLKNHKTSEQSISLCQIAAQSLIFFLAGFETSSSTLMFCLYELSLNPELQSKARRLIKEAFEKYNGQITYEIMMDIPYIDQLLEETLRKYPALYVLNRRASVDYHVPETDTIIEKGTPIIIPVYAIHNDPEFYPNPERFDPDRFDGEEKKKRDAMTWLGFGAGPRNCIGRRFGLMQTWIGLVTLLSNFEFSLSMKSNESFRLNPKSIVTVPENGVYFKIKPITSNQSKSE